MRIVVFEIAEAIRKTQGTFDDKQRAAINCWQRSLGVRDVVGVVGVNPQSTDKVGLRRQAIRWQTDPQTVFICTCGELPFKCRSKPPYYIHLANGLCLSHDLEVAA